jgi:threonine dehydrogenase-like Zn-dependent dehydrogenase
VGSRYDFEQMNRLIEAKQIRLEDIIDRRFGFDEAAEALEYLWNGQHLGKVVLEIAGRDG